MNYSFDIIENIICIDNENQTIITNKLENIVSDENSIIQVNGKTINRNKVVYIPEKVNNFTWKSTFDNIFLTAKSLDIKLDEKEVSLLLSRTGLNGYENHYPSDAKSGYNIRLAIAKALLINPEIIIIDNPFKDLPSYVKQEIISLVKDLSKSIIFIISAPSDVCKLLSKKIHAV